MSKITRISFKLLDLLVIFVLTFGSPMSARAQVWTDPTDYPPGSIVTIRGDNSDTDIDHNFLPGEAVHVDVLGPYGSYTLACDALADGNGAWSCDVTLSSDPSLANGEYMFTATGQASGNVETGTFTDAVVIGGFNIDGVVPDSGSLQFNDPFSNAAELGPLNQNTTKLGVINTDPLPTLGYTSITPGNDLTTAWLQTKVDPSTGHVWLYFAFARAAASTGVVAFEFEKNAAPVACNYAGVNLTDPPGATNTATQDLIANCNPFANRSPGDFLLVFDLQGQQLVIVKRTFLGNGLGFDSTNLDATVSAAAFSGSGNQTGLTGEGAVDLTATVFGTNPTSCFSVANIIPMTITGNSDTADFKDVVLGDFSGTGISSCGTVKVKKVTDPAGGTGSFPYTLSRTDSSALRYDGSTSVTGTLTSDGDIDTIADLKQGTNYTLAEGSVGPTWALVSISCTTDGTTYDVYPGSSAFNVKPSTITTCIITNKKQTGSLKLTKSLSGGPDGYTGPFTIHYDCGLGFINDVSVAAGSSQTVSGILTGTSCTVSEPTLPMPPPGYSFGTPTFSPSDTVTISAGTTVEVTTNNTLSRDTGSFKITKSTSNPDGATLPTFTGTYNCGTGYTGNWSVADGGSQTVTGIPTGNTCSVAEDALTPISGYTWGTPTFTPTSIVISSKGGTFEIVVGNSITRDQGYLKITKSFDPKTSGFNGTFDIVYNCGAGNVTVSLAAGGSTTVGPFDTGTSCSVSEPTLPTAPTGWTFGTPSISGSPATITKGDQAAAVVVTVTNSITRDQGYLKITKSFDPKTSGFNGTFAIVYNCGAGDQTVNLAAGASTTVGPFDTGTSCSVSEPTLPSAPTGWTFGTPSVSGSPATIVKGDQAAAVLVTVTNSITRDLGSLVLAKSLMGGPAGYTGPFTIGWDCGTFGSGSESVSVGGSATVSNIPTGTSCTISETLPSAPTGYSFGTPTFSPSATVVIPAGNGSSVTVTTNNTLTRDLGSLVLAKTLDDGGSGFSGPFTIHYDCGTFGSGDKSVSAGGSATVSSIPTGTNCTISEPTLPSVTGYSFGTPTFSPSATVTIPAGNGSSVTVTTNNTMTRDLGSLVLAKHLDDGGSGFTGPFTIHYDCGTFGSGDKSVSAGGSATISGIPTGTSCTVSEPTLPTVTGYSFGTPTFSPSATVTIPAGNGSSITVTTNNTMTRDLGSLKIIKTVTGASFSGSFSVKVVCTGDGGTYNPSITYPTPGYVTINNIPTGNTCTVTEPTFPTAPNGYVWDTPTITGSPASISKGTTVEVTVANTLKTGHARVVKTVGGLPISATNNCTDVSGNIVGCTFQLRQGATTTSVGTTLETQSTLVNGVPNGTLNFTTLLTPGQTYQMCEIVMPGWLTSLGTFVPNSFLPPDGIATNPAVDNSILCGNFVAQADTTTDVGNIFTIDNTPPPGGLALTIGFWKNWASCTSSSTKKAAILDETLAKAQPNGIVVSATSGTYPVFGATFYLVLHGSTTTPKVAPDCLIAVRLLDKSTIDTNKKMSSDPAFNLAAQLVAAELNYTAGAGKKPAVTTAIQQAVLLLGKYKFDGKTHTKISAADATAMNNLATLLDNYNNNRP